MSNPRFKQKASQKAKDKVSTKRIRQQAKAVGPEEAEPKGSEEWSEREHAE